MTRIEEIKKEYGYNELLGFCFHCKNHKKGDCKKLGIKVAKIGRCRKFDRVIK